MNQEYHDRRDVFIKRSNKHTFYVHVLQLQFYVSRGIDPNVIDHQKSLQEHEPSLK